MPPLRCEATSGASVCLAAFLYHHPVIIRGRLLTDPARTPEPGWLRIENARIAEIAQGDPPRDADTPTLGARDCVITPTFTDAHIHLPQIDSAGCDGLPLLPWLEKVIFPAEIWWGRGHALSMARTAARRMLDQGTAAFAGYLTSHAEINRQVAAYLRDRTPLRFILGRVAMDRNAPDELTAEDRHRAAQRPVPSPVMAPLSSSGRHRISANPRFAVACTDELLAEIGWWHKDHPDHFIQTHLAESLQECALVSELFPRDADYTSVYHRAGLLSPRTLLAHCVHLSDAEWRLIARTRSIAVHCPAANIFLSSGLFNYHAALRHDIRLALGSDVAAGSDLAMPRVARGFIETAKVRRMTIDPDTPIPTPADAWRKITVENADLLGFSDTGRLETGASADLLILRVPETWLDEHVVARLIYNWSSSLIEDRIVAGARVHPDTL